MTTVYTAGHSNSSIEEFIGLLRAAEIQCLVDVRAYPASRRHPQFARSALERSLALAGIRYEWEGRALGGRRRPVKDSPHAALKDPGYRAYADHMKTEEFLTGIGRLVDLAGLGRTAMMCAERLPSECHRSLISDFLVARGDHVMHLVDAEAPQAHQLNPVARLRDGLLYYDGETQGELRL